MLVSRFYGELTTFALVCACKSVNKAAFLAKSFIYVNILSINHFIFKALFAILDVIFHYGSILCVKECQWKRGLLCILSTHIA